MTSPTPRLAAADADEGVIPLMQHVLQENTHLRDKFADAHRRIEALEEERLRARSSLRGQYDESDRSESLFDGNFDIVNRAWCGVRDARTKGSPAAPPTASFLLHSPSESPTKSEQTTRMDADSCQDDELAGESIFLDSPKDASLR